MARTKSFDEDKALEQAMLLFWKKGYSATSMKELEHVMGLTITSIYNAYGNKRALFEKALNYYLQHILVRFIESLDSADSPENALKSVLMEVIHLHFNPSHPGGCLVILSILESEQHDEQSKNILSSALNLLRDRIIQRLEKDKENGEITLETDSQSIANHVTALITGMTTMARAGFSQKDLENLIEDSVVKLLNK
ncbi:TetR/AcrR family transcriptional regulator [Nitrosomonas marina]|uniref:Transcriptional regulator, TetR family n=1 Tax=Nitrosomonas marina TaxID=917 RepID=A0A1H8FYD0_9PROT|nr:TetR/AcrR family transcriptional regulator [Nitrosomonas marina]SEN36247.1 transcriptional regulator, TetR family [Nitrosomonas marina]